MKSYRVQEWAFWGIGSFLLGAGIGSHSLPRDARMVCFFFAGVMLICSVIYEVSSDKR